MEQDFVACLECGKANEPIAQACKYCGAWLGDAENQTLLSTMDVQLRTELEEFLAKENDALSLGENEIALKIIETDDILRLSIEQPLLLGRGDKVRKETRHFIDLGDYGAYRFGLSRDHAEIRYENNTYYLFDLGSSNGTSLNEQEITAKQNYELKNGDQIFLGRLGLIFLCE